MSNSFISLIQECNFYQVKYKSIVLLKIKINQIKNKITETDFLFSVKLEQKVLRSLIQMSGINKFISNLQKIFVDFHINKIYLMQLLSFKLNIQSFKKQIIDYLLFPNKELYYQNDSIGKLISKEITY